MLVLLKKEDNKFETMQREALCKSEHGEHAKQVFKSNTISNLIGHTKERAFGFKHNIVFLKVWFTTWKKPETANSFKRDQLRCSLPSWGNLLILLIKNLDQS